MSDRGTFWPTPPAWPTARIEAPGVTITAAQGGLGVWLLSGNRTTLEALTAALSGVQATLLLAPDRVLLIAAPDAGLAEGWHPTGLAVSDLSDTHICFDLRGPGTPALLARGSASLALNPNPQAAAVGFAGVTVFLQPLPDGARLFVEHSLAPSLWHWLSEACRNAKDHP